MNTQNKHFSYTNTDTLGWGNPNQLDNSKERRAFPSGSSPTCPSCRSAPAPHLLPAQGPAFHSGGIGSLQPCTSHPGWRRPPSPPGTAVPSRPLRAPRLRAQRSPARQLSSQPPPRPGPAPPGPRPASTPHSAARSGWRRGAARWRRAWRGRAGLLEHGLFLLLLLLLPVHHCHDDVPLLLGQVAQVGQLGHRGRHGGRAGTAGPHGRGHLRGLPAPRLAWARRGRAFRRTPGGCAPARLTAEPSRRRRRRGRRAREPGLSWSSASTQPRMLPLFWWPWRGAGARALPAAQPPGRGRGRGRGLGRAGGSEARARPPPCAVREESLGVA